MVGKILFFLSVLQPLVAMKAHDQKIIEESDDQTISYSVLHNSGNHETVSKHRATNAVYRKIKFAFKSGGTDHNVPHELIWQDAEAYRRFEQLKASAHNESKEQLHYSIDYRDVTKQENKEKVTFLGLLPNGNYYKASYNKEKNRYSGLYMYSLFCMRLPFISAKVIEKDAKDLFEGMEAHYESAHSEDLQH